MELMTHGMRQSGMMSSMMSPRQVRGTVLAVLLCSALAGCGSVTASSPAAAPPSSAAATSSAAASASVAASASAAASASSDAVGCASVSQATSVTVHRTMHLVEPARAGAFITTERNPALVRALFGQICAAISQAGTVKGVVHCPADFGVSYSGTFYDGSRPLAKFVYGATGCQTVSITAGGKTQSAMVFGPASAAAPKLRADMAAVIGEPVTMLAPSQSQINPGGPNKPLR